MCLLRVRHHWHSQTERRYFCHHHRLNSCLNLIITRHFKFLPCMIESCETVVDMGEQSTQQEMQDRACINFYFYIE